MNSFASSSPASARLMGGSYPRVKPRHCNHQNQREKSQEDDLLFSEREVLRSSGSGSMLTIQKMEYWRQVWLCVSVLSQQDQGSEFKLQTRSVSGDAQAPRG